MARHVDIDFFVSSNRNVRFALDKLKEAGGLPVVIAPVVMMDGKPTVNCEGRGCRRDDEFLAALIWACRVSPIRMVRLIPAQLVQADCS